MVVKVKEIHLVSNTSSRIGSQQQETANIFDLILYLVLGVTEVVSFALGQVPGVKLVDIMEVISIVSVIRRRYCIIKHFKKTFSFLLLVRCEMTE